MIIDCRILCTDLQAVSESLSAADAYSAFAGILDLMLSQVCQSLRHDLIVCFLVLYEMETISIPAFLKSFLLMFSSLCYCNM